MLNRSRPPDESVLVLGVSSFGEGLQNLGLHTLEGLAESFSKCGWAVEHQADLRAEPMRRELAKARDGQYGVVHILTHGEYKANTEGLWLAGKEASKDVISSDHWVDFRSWLSEAVDFKGVGGLLIFLDTCYAGDAARFDWLDEGARTVYVFAATEPGQLAFRGRFSKAVQRTLDRLQTGDDFGAHPSVEYRYR